MYRRSIKQLTSQFHLCCLNSPVLLLHYNPTLAPKQQRCYCTAIVLHSLNSVSLSLVQMYCVPFSERTRYVRISDIWAYRGRGNRGMEETT